MDDQAAAETLERMVEEHVAAQRALVRRDVAVRLFDEGGGDAVTADMLEAAVDQRWARPDPDTLRRQVGAWAVAALDYERRELAHRRQAVENMRAKVAKFEGLLGEVREQLAAAEAAVGPAEAAVAEARDLARYVLGADPPPDPGDDAATAHAETAHLGVAGSEV